MVANIASAAAQPAHRWFAAVVAGLLILAALLAGLANGLVLPALAAFQPMVAAALALSGAVTAYLLFGQFLLSGLAVMGWLAGAYLFNGLISAAGALAADPHASPLWHVAHFAQLSFLLGFALLQARAPGATLRAHRTLLWPIAVAAATALLVGLAWLLLPAALAPPVSAGSMR